jgi:nucleotide-binding universal stress UspA family protein
MKILATSDGSPESEQAASFLSHLRLPAGSGITLLGVQETPRDETRLRESLERMRDRLSGLGVELQVKVRHGHAAEEIVREVEQHGYDLVAMGAHGRRKPTRFRLGSTTSRLARELPASLLVCRRVPPRVSRVLISSGGESPSLETVGVGGHLAGLIGAEVGLLHVMSQVALDLESPIEDLADTAETAMARGTREGRHLEQAIELLREAGVTAPVTPKLRHGLVVDEVLREVREGGYDLLVIGSRHRPGVSRWLDLVLDDVAYQIIAHAPCSVVVAHAPR